MAAIVCRLVEVCVFAVDAGLPKYLLLQRSKSDKIYPGIWQWVTGTMKESESAVQAAVRELTEETGMKPVGFWIVPHVNTFYVAADDTVHLSPFFAAEVASDDRPRLLTEHQAFEWCSFDRAREMLPWPGQRRGLEVVHQYITGKEEAARLTRFTL